MFKSRRTFLRQRSRSAPASILILILAVGLGVKSGSAQNTPVSLETSETLFTVLTAINTCGYDQELGASIRCERRSDWKLRKLRKTLPELRM